jgi:hypothetical protein
MLTNFNYLKLSFYSFILKFNQNRSFFEILKTESIKVGIVQNLKNRYSKE